MKYILILFVCFIGLFTACNKATLQQYIAGDGVYFYSIDSANYSFANQVGLVEKDTVFVKMRVLGDVKDFDRAFQLKAVKGTTAKENIHYILPKISIKSNTNTIEYPVVLLNAPDLKTNTLRLELEVLENESFPQGSGIINNGLTYSMFKINFSNRLLKPTYWNNIQSYFGEYSDVKYKFMIDETGFSDFSFQVFNDPELINFKGLLNVALQEYVKVNGPLLDENQKPISFPN
ncbi:DUF4843 domain-containing protein [Sphingobacterium bovistauri]|uniref:DUF4843 domain-containing protein n=1 Tax=Sphingobacterium bovistauri TaxID=2781959 RepID=A0ABS7Z9A2_9SPHI|nr:DUF4843 domain-containing protein [Sphingobacterium bovistauri]MCA5006756.1 DUF4843 domain-containing protein [Sphingobacterium bovistauri]